VPVLVTSEILQVCTRDSCDKRVLAIAQASVRLFVSVTLCSFIKTVQNRITKSTVGCYCATSTLVFFVPLDDRIPSNEGVKRNA